MMLVRPAKSTAAKKNMPSTRPKPPMPLKTSGRETNMRPGPLLATPEPVVAMAGIITIVAVRAARVSNMATFRAEDLMSTFLAR